jgi:hypothetical protein
MEPFEIATSSNRDPIEKVGFTYTETLGPYETVKSVFRGVKGDAGYLPDILAAFHDFLVSVGFDYVADIEVISTAGVDHSASESEYYRG